MRQYKFEIKIQNSGYNMVEEITKSDLNWMKFGTGGGVD